MTGLSLALLAWALDAAHRGRHVIPLRPQDKRPAGHAEKLCPGTGRCADGHLKPEQRATTDVELITAAWTQQPYNIGIATGPSGLLVVDLDTLTPEEPEGTPDGVQSLLALCERAGESIPDTYQVRTPSGGHHLYFTQPPGVRLHSTAGRLGHHIDTRGWGGYVVAPASTTLEGSYSLVDDRPPAVLPGWLCEALTQPHRPDRAASATPVTTNASGYAAAALRGEVSSVATAADGSRNAVLLRAARALGRLIASGDLDRAEVEEALSRAAGGNATQPQRYYDDVITRGLDWSIAHNPQRRAA
ncbi:bifunctional DNA primase/polymerase [Streptomyces sp. ISL-98]|uniref:bifunctional DNA primase/polymerase n=1 Tax=Streptomyces sp. ISL-98 TaxID=2819192 RepID=UPI001BE7BE83|nr:bifunctional DNA primase/polymerase [Streptomyces sp. ISL-98]MBT2511040.1 bifunctional DNA primase/polymerase [Streptomyces sp. ISL-98]